MNDRRVADVSKQPLPWSVMFPGTGGDEEAERDMADSAGMPRGRRVVYPRRPSLCKHEGNPRGFTWCKHCGTRIV